MLSVLVAAELRQPGFTAEALEAGGALGHSREDLIRQNVLSDTSPATGTEPWGYGNAVLGPLLGEGL